MTYLLQTWEVTSKKQLPLYHLGNVGWTFVTLGSVILLSLVLLAQFQEDIVTQAMVGDCTTLSASNNMYTTVSARNKE